MATFKKSAKKSTARKAGTASSSEGLTKTLSESAQQIWLAGMGAFGRAQSEGTKLFEALVKEGLNLEQTARKLAGGQADAVRDVVETQVGNARERAAGTWDRVEKSFEDRVQRVLRRMDIPSRSDIEALNARLDALNARLNRAEAQASTRPSPDHT